MSSKRIEIPEKIFTFSEKSQFPGKSPGQILFTIKNGWKNLLKRLETIESHDTGKRDKTFYHKYLLWFLKTIEEIEKMEITDRCSICGQKKAKYIPIFISYRDSQHDLSKVCCEECKKKLPYNYSFQKISLLNFIQLRLNKKTPKWILNYMREQLGLPKKLTRKKIFNWLLKKNQEFQQKKYIKEIKGQLVIDFSKIDSS